MPPGLTRALRAESDREAAPGTASGAVEQELLDGVLVLTFRRGNKLNALDVALLDSLLEGLQRAKVDDVDAVVLLGEGRAFCAGADLSLLDVGRDAELAYFLDRLAAALLALGRLRTPVVVGFQGAAVGAGAELALEADLRIATDDARLSFPDLGLGSTPATVRALVELVGRSVASEVVLVGRDLEAAELLDRGVVHRVVAADGLRAASIELARTVTGRGGALQRRLAKEALRAAGTSTLSAELRANVARMLQCAASESVSNGTGEVPGGGE